MNLTQAEIDRYAPYHTFPEFKQGYANYLAGGPEPDDENFRNSVGGQAYDRGAECAMRRQMAQFRNKAAPDSCDCDGKVQG